MFRVCVKLEHCVFVTNAFGKKTGKKERVAFRMHA